MTRRLLNSPEDYFLEGSSTLQGGSAIRELIGLGTWR